MTSAQGLRLSVFGGSVGERGLRVATGGAVATAAVTAGFLAAGFDWRLILLLTLNGVMGTAGVRVLEGSRPSAWPQVRYAALGALLACASVLWLSRATWAWLAVLLPIGMTTGAASGALAVLVAARLPRGQLPWVLCVGVAVVAASLGGGIVRTLPWLPGSYLKVEGPSNWTSAEQLAARLAERLEAQPDPLSDESWGKVAFETVTPDEGGSTAAGYERAANERKITVWLNGDRACVLVRATSVDSYAGNCRDS
ncbi:MAG: hypothetical protein WD794_17650 [Mycobacteriales bacterium]